MMKLPTSLLPFKINRIHTELGIFKVNGYRSSVSTDKMTIILSTVFILSTDGWEELILTQPNSNLLEQLIPYLEHHLMSIL
ncbi:hypothetical protein QP231_20560 [Klebsiella pneumoniae]|jgi:hypothetical protein|uniref:hypothetical protein n=1 Tax=Enterobacteriaceae TaxID=543 RepID=UPI00122FA9DF|nr:MULTISPECIES: hypothetical protein [Enterobacteriaceae]EMC9795806.1 hypothetical protein [Enterobacter kobei]HEB4094319.1 hypothetical protein [Enterobacter cloacae]EIW8629812.1 hypothetical protein [Klebsiella pneumoniae]EKV1479099.1 hypothetical protein [Klebsiella pneumoniae]ELA2048424.1 hypothetical protein [Klebsiella pneumoniae]